MFLRVAKYSLGFMLMAAFSNAAQAAAKSTHQLPPVLPVPPGDVSSAELPFEWMPVDFDLSRAVAAGNACKLNDTAFLNQNGSGLEIRLSDFYVSLADNLGLGRSRLASCRVVVPVTIPRGYYVAEIRHSGSYFIHKSAQTQGSFAVRANIVGSEPALLKVDFPAGSSAYRRSPFANVESLSQSGQCNPLGSDQSILSVQFSASAIGDSSDLFDFELANGGRTSLSLRLASCN